MKPGTFKLYLSAADIQVAFKELTAKGIKAVNEIINVSWGRRFVSNDPDGNHWLIVQS
jgi:uncharacterized glyoxalase superfamily protein PhnB